MVYLVADLGPRPKVQPVCWESYGVKWLTAGESNDVHMFAHLIILEIPAFRNSRLARAVLAQKMRFLPALSFM